MPNVAFQMMRIFLFEDSFQASPQHLDRKQPDTCTSSFTIDEGTGATSGVPRVIWASLLVGVLGLACLFSRENRSTITHQPVETGGDLELREGYSDRAVVVD